MLIAQISDLHIKAPGRPAYGVVETDRLLQRCVERLQRLNPAPDIIVASGDLVDAGKPEEYAYLKELLAPLRSPVYLMPGNHDSRTALRAAFAQDGYMGGAGEQPIQYTVEDYGVRIVVLDSTIPGHDGGELDAARLGWLDETLSAAPNYPTIVFMHHPPFRTGIEGMDIPFRGADKLAGVIERYNNVERIACGHLHRPIIARFGGTIASTSPSTAHQLLLDVRPGQPVQFVMEPAAFTLHYYADDSGLVSHLALVDHFDGPFPFRAAGKLID